MRAGILAIVGGALLLLSGIASSTLLFDRIGDFVADHWPDAGGAVDTVLQVLSFLASFGGLVIIVGGVLMLVGFEGIGRLVTWIAALMALVGWIILVVVLVDQGEARDGATGWLLDAAVWLSLVGIVLAFWARPRTA